MRNNKPVILLITASACALVFSLTSCAFVEDLLGDLFTSHVVAVNTLTIEYDYYGSAFSPGLSQIIFWVMPLDNNNEVMEDPDDPGGPPLRRELYAFDTYGTTCTDLESRKYLLLAFLDEHGDGYLSLHESYVIYDDKSLESGLMDKINLNEDKSVYVGFDDRYVWRAVFITNPSDGDYVQYESGSFLIQGGILHDGITTIEVWDDSNNIHLGNAWIDHSNNYWHFPVSTLLPDSWYVLRVAAYDLYVNFVDEHKIIFYLQN
jgi:hypothetical protein